MIKKDYLLRPLFVLLDEIVAKFSDVATSLTLAIKATKRDEVYQKYLNQSREKILQTPNQELIAQFADTKQLELLAEIVYQDFLIEIDAVIKKELHQKALAIFKHLAGASANYDMLRAQKIKQLELWS